LKDPAERRWGCAHKDKLASSERLGGRGNGDGKVVDGFPGPVVPMQ
jgi:hypothetical protein